MGKPTPKHEHIVFHLADGTAVRYSDTRRFGLMDLIPGASAAVACVVQGPRHRAARAKLNAHGSPHRLKGKATSIKAALLDQRLIAGIGNIYACEALFRAGIRRCGLPARSYQNRQADQIDPVLVKAVKAVLGEAIKAGGSALRDYARADGRLGRFQHPFKVYGREGKRCRRKAAGGTVRRIVQSGRSTFYCPSCQR